MLKKFLFSFLLLLNASSHAFEMDLEFKVGGFVPTDKVFREIYSDVLTTYGGEIDVGLGYGVNLFIEGDYLTDSGRSLGASDRTRIELGGLGVGLEYTYPIASFVDIYAGLGPKAFFFKTIDHNSCVRETTKKTDVGGVGKLGLIWSFFNQFYIDTFVEYSYCRMHFKADPSLPVIPFNVNVGGIFFGGGLGYRF